MQYCQAPLKHWINKNRKKKQFEMELEPAANPTSVPSSVPGKMSPRLDPQKKPPPERDKQDIAGLPRVRWDRPRVRPQRPRVRSVRKPQRSVRGCARYWISMPLAKGQVGSTNPYGTPIRAPFGCARRPDNTGSIVAGRRAGHARACAGWRRGHSVPH